jgi:hypothetical protein
MKVGSSYMVVMSVSLNATMFFKQLNTYSPLGFGGAVILATEYATGFRADYRTTKEAQAEFKINCKTFKNCLTPLTRCGKKAQKAKN